MNKHTPGPWEVYEQHHPYLDGNRHHVERWILTGYDDPQAKGPYPIVTLSAGIGLTGQKGVQFLHITRENARLIAAAPDLLEALKGILYHFVPMQGNLKIENDMIKQAHAAIAKATGEANEH